MSFKYLFSSLVFLLTFSLIQNANGAQDSVFVEVIKLRKYPGGVDESDLKVRPVLNRSTNKKKKTNPLDVSDGF